MAKDIYESIYDFRTWLSEHGVETNVSHLGTNQSYILIGNIDFYMHPDDIFKVLALLVNTVMACEKRAKETL